MKSFSNSLQFAASQSLFVGLLNRPYVLRSPSPSDCPRVFLSFSPRIQPFVLPLAWRKDVEISLNGQADLSAGRNLHGIDTPMFSESFPDYQRVYQRAKPAANGPNKLSRVGRWTLEWICCETRSIPDQTPYPMSSILDGSIHTACCSSSLVSRGQRTRSAVVALCDTSWEGNSPQS